MALTPDGRVISPTIGREGAQVIRSGRLAGQRTGRDNPVRTGIANACVLIR